jgi:glycerol-3-phosphate acyltransferase PlsY
MIENLGALYYEITHTGFNLAVLAVFIVGAYIIGTFSPSILLGRLHGVDIRSKGSGNAGTTNALRVLGKKAAVITLIIDILKGAIVIILTKPLCGGAFALVCGFAVLCGHIWPAFFGFRGGKGVATALGVILAFDIRLGLLVAGIALLLIFITRRVSIGALVASAALPVGMQFMHPAYLLPTAAITVIIWVKHRQNIIRLIKGQEPALKFSSGNKEK